jgi:hypothetical protein
MKIALFAFPEYKLEQYNQLYDSDVDFNNIHESVNTFGSGIEVMKYTGYNTGNLVFWFAVRKLIDIDVNDIYTFSWNTPVDFVLKEKPDIIILPCSNYINNYFDISKTNLVNIIKNVNVPVIPFGLGYQGEIGSKLNILDGNIQFLKELSLKSHTIFLRGNDTKIVCDEYGIKNYCVTGCPSLFLNPNPHLGKIMESKYINSPKNNIVVHSLSLKTSLIKTERNLFNYANNHYFQYIFQETPYLIDKTNTEKMNEVNNYYNDNSFLIKSNPVCFTNPFYWINYIKTHFNFGIGTRIHGTMVTLAAEIPVVLIAHDLRTKELAESMFIPFVSEFNIEEINNIKINGTLFDENRKKIALIYNDILIKHGLTPSKHLTNLLV